MIDRIKELQTLFIERGKAKILGSSLFFVCARDYYDEHEMYDDKLTIVSVSLIDLCHMEPFQNSSERDDGFI